MNGVDYSNRELAHLSLLRQHKDQPPTNAFIKLVPVLSSKTVKLQNILHNL